MKLEVKHLAPYLPYRLKIQGVTYGQLETLFGIKGETVFIESSTNLYAWCDIFDIKPILRPIEDIKYYINFLNTYYLDFDSKEGILVKRKDNSFNLV